MSNSKTSFLENTNTNSTINISRDYNHTSNRRNENYSKASFKSNNEEISLSNLNNQKKDKKLNNLINLKEKLSEKEDLVRNLNLKIRSKITSTLPIILKHIINNNINLNSNFNLDTYTTAFDINNPERIPIDIYIKRIIDLSQAENNTIIYSLALIDKLCTTKGFLITNKNIHKLFFISLLSSLKLLEDKIFNDKDYSVLSGITSFEMVQLESIFLASLEYKIVINEDNFIKYFQTFNN